LFFEEAFVANLGETFFDYIDLSVAGSLRRFYVVERTPN